MNDTFSQTFVAKNGTKFEYGFRYFKGNGKPYFFVNYEEMGRGGRIEACGTPSFKTLQKHAPHLAVLHRWHLSDIDGRPTHYEPNARYWLEKVLGVSPWPTQSYDPDPTEAFKSTVVFGACTTDKDLPTLDTLDAWLAARLPDLKNAFQANLAGLELWGPAQKWWATLQAA